VFLKRDPSTVGDLAYGEDKVKAEDAGLESKSFTFKEAILTKVFWLFCIALLCYGFCFFALQVHIAPYATDKGISSTEAATIMAVIGGATIVSQIGFGSIGDKIGYRRTFLIGLIFIVLAIMTLMLARDLWVFFISAALLGIGFGNCSTQESPMAAWLFGLGSHGVILGFLAFSFTIGAAIGPLVFGYIFDGAGSYQMAFWLAGILAIVALILSLLLRRPSPSDFVLNTT
jgi:MFS family permease